jgi:hypothetical protein
MARAVTGSVLGTRAAKRAQPTANVFSHNGPPLSFSLMRTAQSTTLVDHFNGQEGESALRRMRPRPSHG